jgi:hypothetical protein
MDIAPVNAHDQAGKKIDAIRELLTVTNIREIGKARRERLRELDLRDAAHRLGVAFAMFLPPNAPMPSDDFLLEHAERIYNAILGTTRTPEKVR